MQPIDPESGGGALLRRLAGAGTGLRGGTTNPASRAIAPLSPTSVTMTGKPQAIASPSATEVPSPKCDASMKMSAAE
jgi:hypothetical protein